MNTAYLEATAILATLLFFTIFSYKKRFLDLDGIIIANILGLFVFLLGGIHSFLLMVFFYIVAEASTRLGRKGTKTEHEQRTIGNVIGNSGAAILTLLFHSQIGFFGAISAALADTLSSEIGLLSKKKPRLITTFEEVEPGTNGGVTLLGIFAATIGASLIGLFYFIVAQNVFHAIIIAIAGVCGSLVDSYFGAKFELKGILNNTEVNFIGSASGAMIAKFLSLFF